MGLTVGSANLGVPSVQANNSRLESSLSNL